MFKWRSKRSRDTPSTPAPPPDSDAWDGSTRDQWTIPGVYFETGGWRLSEGTDTQMSWVGAFGGTMTLRREDVPAWTADDIDLDAVRRKERSAAAAARRGGLVSAEIVTMASGARALEVLTQYAHGMGYSFEGRLLIADGPLAYLLVLPIDETETGVRESIVDALRMQLGELDLTALMSGPVDPDTGGRTIPGMQLDPYDSLYDEQATYSASDDPRLDDLLQTHPLAVIRSTLRRARSTWECASSAPGTATAHQSLPHSAGPRVVLSEDFFRKLYEMARSH